MNELKAYIKRTFWLIPAALSVVICVYFANLLHLLRVTIDINEKALLLRELSFAIAVLLLFTVIANWFIIVYVKNLKYKYTHQGLTLRVANDRKR